jgi:hypothetical protein
VVETTVEALDLHATVNTVVHELIRTSRPLWREIAVGTHMADATKWRPTFADLIFLKRLRVEVRVHVPSAIAYAITGALGDGHSKLIKIVDGPEAVSWLRGVGERFAGDGSLRLGDMVDRFAHALRLSPHELGDRGDVESFHRAFAPWNPNIADLSYLTGLPRAVTAFVPTALGYVIAAELSGGHENLLDVVAGDEAEGVLRRLGMG